MPKEQLPTAITPTSTEKKKTNWKIILIVGIIAVILIGVAGYTSIKIGIFSKSFEETNKTAITQATTSVTPTTSKESEKEEKLPSSPVKLEIANNHFEKTITGVQFEGMPEGIITYTHASGMIKISSREIKGLSTKLLNRFDDFLDKGKEIENTDLQSLSGVFPTAPGGFQRNIFVSEISNVTYEGVDKYRIATTMVGQTDPFDIGIKIYAKKGLDYLEISSSSVLLAVLNDEILRDCGYKKEDHSSHTSKDFDNINACAAKKVTTDSRIIKNLQDAANQLSNIFRLK